MSNCNSNKNGETSNVQKSGVKKTGNVPLPAIHMKSNSFDHVNIIANFIRTKTHYKPSVGIICGSGLDKIMNQIEKSNIIQYCDIPGFPICTVVGHKGNFVFGILEGKTVVCMQGRFHPFEGYSSDLCTLPIRVMKLLGVKTLITTSAVGGINRNYREGDIMLIKDHLFMPGFAGFSPLYGQNDDRFGPRFLSMQNAYDKDLRKLVKDTAKENAINIQEGVYAELGGPQFETPAEVRLLKLIGADVVGLSVPHEVIMARHNDVKCIGLAVITNMCELDSDSVKADISVHEEVLKTAGEVGEKLSKLVAQIVYHL